MTLELCFRVYTKGLTNVPMDFSEERMENLSNTGTWPRVQGVKRPREIGTEVFPIPRLAYLPLTRCNRKY